RRESIRIIAKTLVVHALKLDGKISGPAVVLGQESVGLPARGGADQIHLDVDAAQRIDDGFAGRTGACAGQYENSPKPQIWQRLVRRAGETLAHGMKRGDGLRRRQA